MDDDLLKSMDTVASIFGGTGEREGCEVCGKPRHIWNYDNGDLLNLDPAEDDLFDSGTYCPDHAPEGWTQREREM